MDFDKKIDNFSRTALGYVTTAIAAIFFLLVGLLVTKLFSGPSFQLIGFALTMVFLAGWFAKLSINLPSNPKTNPFILATFYHAYLYSLWFRSFDRDNI